ncbi:MAG: fimbrillin family protein [Bacteroidales bacterium]|nr:fimbrillin family protein [Candidatus Cacconaster merdequi]
MKTEFFFLAALAALCFTSCNKSELTPATQSNKIVALVDVIPSTKVVTTYDSVLRTNGFSLVGYDGERLLFKSKFSYDKSVNSKAFTGEAYWPSTSREYTFYASYPPSLAWDGSSLEHVDVTSDPVLAYAVSAKQQYLPLDFYHIASRIGTSITNTSSYNLKVNATIKNVATSGEFRYADPVEIEGCPNKKFDSGCWISADEILDIDSFDSSINAGGIGNATYYNVIGVASGTEIVFDVTFLTTDGNVVDIKTYTKSVDELVPGIVYQYNLVITDNSVEPAAVEVKKGVTVEDWDSAKVDVTADPNDKPENPEPIWPTETAASLESLINECTPLNENDYTENSWDALKTALDNGRLALSNKDNDEILMTHIENITMYRELLEGPVPSTQDAMQLAAKIQTDYIDKYAPGKDDPNDYEYTEESLAVWNAAFAEAKSVVETSNSLLSTRAGRWRISLAYNNIAAAYEGLKMKGTEVDIDDGMGTD